MRQKEIKLIMKNQMRYLKPKSVSRNHYEKLKYIMNQTEVSQTKIHYKKDEAFQTQSSA